MRLTLYKTKFPFLFIVALLVMISSCSLEKRTSVKNYPPDTPFVYDSKVILKGNLSKDEKNRLTGELENYWDDSLKSRKVQQFGFLYKIKNPPVFDTVNINRSINFMNAYLNSQGYYYAGFSDSLKVDTIKDQLRTMVFMNIRVNKNITIDSVSYDLGDSTLESLAKKDQKNSLLKKGAPYTIQSVSSELDRLVSIYRQNGYYRFTRDDIFASVDTTDTKLLQLTLDPFKQAQILAEAAKDRRDNPTWNIAIQKRPIKDSAKLTQYHIGKLYYYPETKISDIPDSLINKKGFREFTRKELVMRFTEGKFNYHPLREHTYLRSGQLYDENSYYKSINTLGQIGAWQQVDALQEIRGKDSLDIYFFLIPAIKQSYTISQEVSLNTADIGITNLWGISTNLTYTNKNVWKRAVQSITSFRTGVELNILSNNQDQVLQTFLISLGHTYVIPRLVQPFNNWNILSKAENKKTLLSVSGSYVDRLDYYQLRSLVTSWGYEWRKGNNVWLYKPLNIELYALDKEYLLDSLIQENPFLKASFNEGKIVSQILTLTRNFKSPGNPNISQYIRTDIEEAGGLLGFFSGLKDQIYRYIKVDGEYRLSIKTHKSEWAFRAFAGVGYNYGTDPTIGQTLPFFKQFFAGGPYSMRAWGLRQLGLGSSILSDTISTSTYRDRFGDMQLETNVEYRFPLATIASLKIGSAFFADIGNIWSVKKLDSDPQAQFSIEHLTRDLAIGMGTGLRFDFSYFLIRFDFAYKVKDPARQYNDGGWMRGFSLTETRQNGVVVNNYAVQLGIGMPF